MTKGTATVERAKRDMYGHEIVPIGDGFGVSLAFARHLDGAVTPYPTFFHASDGFRQSLFTVGSRDESPHRPQITNIFDDRLQEVLSMLKGDGGKP